MNLLDVNLLVALCDADHVHHRPTAQWFRSHRSDGWATCPLTENGLLRIVGHARYPGGPGSPEDVRPLLQRLRSIQGTCSGKTASPWRTAGHCRRCKASPRGNSRMSICLLWLSIGVPV